MVELKHDQIVQVCTQEELDDLPDSENGEKPKVDIEEDYSVLGYTPTAVDYIRRCRTLDEAFEIIDYLKKRGEITEKEYKTLSEKLKSEGLTGFGTIKETGFYGNGILK